MSIEVTPGSRLRDLIEKRGYKMKVFAEITGVVPNTLSKFVNGKPMSDKYIKKAAEVLDVTPEYIKCKSDDMTPPRYLQYTKDIPQEEKNVSRQIYRFSFMGEMLNAMGVDIIWKAKIGESGDPTLIGTKHGWIPVDGKTEQWMDEYGVDEEEFIKLLNEHPGSKVWIEMTFKDRKVSMDYSEYQRWMRSMVASIELKIQEKFDLFYDISMRVEETEINQALRGEIKDEAPKKNGKPPKPTEEEKLLEEIFGVRPK